MRTLYLLAFCVSCAKPVPIAHADASQPATTPSSSSSEASTVRASATPKSPPATPPLFSTLTGIRLVPSEQVRKASPELIKEHDDNMLRNNVKRDCATREDYVIDSVPAFRQVNLIRDAFLKDASDIGWTLTIRKGFSNAVIYDGQWHGLKADILLLMTDPRFLFISICQGSAAALPTKT